MKQQYFCNNHKRHQTLKDSTKNINGIDYLEVLDSEAEDIGSPRQKTLLVRCFRPLPPDIRAANVRILGGVRVTPVGVEWVGRAADAADLKSKGWISEAERQYFLDQSNPERVLVVRTESDGDFSTYRLCLVSEQVVLLDFDPILSEVDFSFKVECPSEFDCLSEEVCPPEAETAPPIDYLSKDYASFRRLMLDRLALVMPEWRERSAADAGVALVEVMAYAADYLSCHQDAVATEAYLGTARRRTSLRRHARLLDYAMHEGCNARAWVFIRVAEGVSNMRLKRDYGSGKRTRFLTRVIGKETSIGEKEFGRISASQGLEVFEPMHDLVLFEAHNDLQFHTWGEEQCCLPQGATRATLLDNAANRLQLHPGDVLLFEEVLSPDSGMTAHADPTKRHAVRLIRVDPQAEIDENGHRVAGALKMDELLEKPVVDIEWSVEDALPFSLCLSAKIESNGETTLVTNISMAHGNVLLADHGRTVSGEPLPMPHGGGRYRPPLGETDIIHSETFSSASWQAAEPGTNGWLSAAAALKQDPRRALPAVELLSGEGEDWHPERDLLSSDRFDADFVVEVESDGRAFLRFGDNLYGKRPESGVSLDATYRTGRLAAGHVGAEAIAHIVTESGETIEKVRNPMPASGAAPPEALEDVRQYAPQAFRRQERAVTTEDYARMAEQHSEVSKARARRLWTGSWYTLFITVDRRGGRPVDRAFEEELGRFLARFQLAHHDVEIEPPRFVSLDIAFTVCVKAGYLQSDVKLALLEVFSNRDFPDGRRGFFHPDRFTFGQRVYLSQIVATAMSVPGVRWVEVDAKGVPPSRFQRWGEKPRGEIAAGFIDMGHLEIARLDNDPNAPENGKIEFFIQGGL